MVWYSFVHILLLEIVCGNLKRKFAIQFKYIIDSKKIVLGVLISLSFTELFQLASFTWWQSLFTPQFQSNEFWGETP